MDFVPVLIMALIVNKTVGLIKDIGARNVNGVVTLLVAVGAGIGAVFLFASSAWGSGIEFGKVTVDTMNGASLVLAGIAVGCGAAAVQDAKKTFDVTQSAKEPTLVE